MLIKYKLASHLKQENTMKKLLITIILLYALNLQAQPTGSGSVTSIYMCYIKYQYDANGNRTNRAYSCEWYTAQTPNQNSRTAPPNSIVSSIVFPNPSSGKFTVSSNSILEASNTKTKICKGKP